MAVQITVADVRRLAASQAGHRAVLYVECDEDTGEPIGVDVWVDAYVSQREVIATRTEVEDALLSPDSLTLDDVSDEAIEDYLPDLQAVVDEIVTRLA
jgi:hypothetical protein